MRENPGCSSPSWPMSTTGRKATGMILGGWRKSSYSGSSQTSCVEVLLRSDLANIRDSKNADGPRLAVGASSWSTFVASVKPR
ncbi:MAG TPA: DUF397 domain-containing protein [Actinokineospora sp.]|nr:DUF397 domain-containing protein [Actinokineospora sp.]